VQTARGVLFVLGYTVHCALQIVFFIFMSMSNAKRQKPQFRNANTKTTGAKWEASGSEHGRAWWQHALDLHVRAHALLSYFFWGGELRGLCICNMQHARTCTCT
jgi:hypothetical protein